MFKKTKTAVLMLLISGSVACVNDDVGEPPVSEFDFSAMFTNVADSVIVPNYQAVSQSARALAADSGEIAAYCSDINANTLQQAQDGWAQVMSAVQRTELHIIGPAAANNAALRNRLTSFGSAQLSTCGIDQSVVQASQDANFDIGSKTLNQRSMAALEYLLFNDNLAHTCPSQIAETSDWDARPEAERRELRCAYAQRVAADVADAADQIVEAWTDYRSEFVNPTQTADSLELLTDALFAIELDVKDVKVGAVLGLNSRCSSIACPEGIESPYAENTVANVRDNLLGFQAVYSGGEGLGLDDLIISENMPALAQQYIDLSQQTADFAQTVTPSLLQQANAIVAGGDATNCVNASANPSEDSAASACRLHGMLKQITDSLRTEFIAAVNVDLPDRGQSDND